MEVSSATVRMLAFAGARDAIGAAEVELPWRDVAAIAGSSVTAGGSSVPAGGSAAGASSSERTPTAADVLALACARWPALAPFRACLRVAVNGSYAEPGHPVAAGDEVALIPPVAGG